MLFNSYEFFVFLGLILLLFYSCPYRYRWLILLGGSYLFYVWWRWDYALLMLGVSWVNWYCARRIHPVSDRARARLWLILSLCISLLTLFVFKYYHFADNSLRGLAQWLGFSGLGLPHLEVLLPVGISFFTFQAMSYTVDVYRNRTEQEPSFGRFALFVSFFPQLVAGPIERASHLLGQLRARHRLDLTLFPIGAKLILWGLFKKVVIADRLAIYVDRIYENPSLYSGSTLLLATYFFAFQIYCDFSGYSDIAIGVASFFGIRLMQNFNLPYFASSIGEFWQRWHISLSTWFRDYVYIALGGNRVSAYRFGFNIIAVFAISGLWHGAAWTFVNWGLLHGCYYLAERIFSGWSRKWSQLNSVTSQNTTAANAIQIETGWQNKVWTALKIALTFHLVLLAWVFFRAKHLDDALTILLRIASDPFSRLYWGPSQLATMLGLLFILLLLAIQLLQSRGWISLYFSKSRLPAPVRWCGYLALCFGIAIFGVSSNRFIYFQF